MILNDSVKIRKGATYPPVRIYITDERGPIDLTGASATFSLWTTSRYAVLSNRPAVISDPTNGVVEYEWIDGETDTAGDYRGLFEIVLASGKKLTVPVDGAINIKITEVPPT